MPARPQRLFAVAALALLPAAADAAPNAATVYAAPDAVTVDAVDPADSILSEYVPQAAPDPNPPPYTLLRYNERYDVLADPRNRHDFFDLVKYIALDADDPQRYLSLGGELRERYENLDNPGFGTGRNGADSAYLLQRLTFGVDLHLNARLRLFAQGISGVQLGDTERASPVQQNPVDLEQGFVDYIFGEPTPEGPRLTTRVGRFEMTYGSGRLVATRAAPNIPLNFDGAQLIAGLGAARLYAFAVHPVQQRKYRLDTDNGGQSLWGVYGTAPLGGRFGNLDLYYLGARYDESRYIAGTAAELRHTFGSRAFGKVGAWDYDWEPVVQFGRYGDRPILAWTLATDTGYTLKSLPWRPRLGLKADIASGDSGNGHGRFGAFNPLYFKAGYFNDASVIRPTNVADVHPSLQLVPSRWLTATLASDLLWRYSLGDGVYGPAGNLELRPGAGSRYIGQTVEAALQWKASRHWSGAVSYVQLFASDATRAADGRDVRFFGSWVTFVW